MERAPWTRRLNRRLPLRFRDPLPQPPPLLPPPPLIHSIASTSQSTANNRTALSSSLGSSSGAVRRRLCQVFRTVRNVFGLSRLYHTAELPSHDPEEYNELSDIPSQSPSTSALPTFYPYPNHSSFRLGEWYWNGGVQKSQSSFNELLDIVGDRGFEPAAVRDTKWSEINNILASGEDEEWLDEDAGWKHTAVTIEVPYQLRRGVTPDPDASPRSYTIDDFYHRSLVSVIREKLSDSTGSHRHFHYEPFELNWQPGEVPRPVRVQGELYTSPAFIDAHRELRDSPAEPGCSLPRVVAALMFWSDVTHLTSFGDAKIWPLYMFFGNESKYYRCKPSCHLCHHIAYFHSVGAIFLLIAGSWLIVYAIASWGLQGFRHQANRRGERTQRSIHGTLRSGAHARPMDDST
jgi:Plavaka transposase